MVVSSGAACTTSSLFFKQKTAYDLVSGDWSSDVCSSDLRSRSTAAVSSGRPPLCGRGGAGAGDLALARAHAHSRCAARRGVPGQRARDAGHGRRRLAGAAPARAARRCGSRHHGRARGGPRQEDPRLHGGRGGGPPLRGWGGAGTPAGAARHRSDPGAGRRASRRSTLRGPRYRRAANPHSVFLGGCVSHTVLVCDDAIFMRTMISDILAQAGFEIVGEAETGSQAVEKYRQLKPDLVTMDIVMPDMGGIDAVREIVKQDPDAKILMCSAMGQQALVVEAIQAGARDFVVKPFQPSRVLEAVQRVLG